MYGCEILCKKNIPQCKVYKYFTETEGTLLSNIDQLRLHRQRKSQSGILPVGHGSHFTVCTAALLAGGTSVDSSGK